MAKNKIDFISDELLAAYLEGKTTAEETRRILRALSDDEELQEILVTAERVDSFLNEGMQEYTLLPMAEMAAEGEGNLCDIQCEAFILNKRGISFDETALPEEARSNRWLKDKGTPLHSIGRLLEQKGLSVIRRYNSTLADLGQALDAGNDVIVVVNCSKLTDSKGVNADPNHAIVVLRCDSQSQTVQIFDPASGRESEECSVTQFEEAWADSNRYLVCVKEKDNVYDPQPIDLEDIDLTEDLLELREAIAENAHDVWAYARIQQGWTYGSVRDDAKMHHPDLVPYAELPDGEKEYDRIMAFNTIKLVKKLGYDMVKHKDTEIHKLLMGRLHRQEKAYRCKACGVLIFKGQVYCSGCGKRLEWRELI